MKRLNVISLIGIIWPRGWFVYPFTTGMKTGIQVKGSRKANTGFPLKPPDECVPKVWFFLKGSSNWGQRDLTTEFQKEKKGVCLQAVLSSASSNSAECFSEWKLQTNCKPEMHPVGVLPLDIFSLSNWLHAYFFNTMCPVPWHQLWWHYLCCPSPILLLNW